MPLDVPRMLTCCAAFGDVDGAQESNLILDALSRRLQSRDPFLLSPPKTCVLVHRHPQLQWVPVIKKLRPQISVFLMRPTEVHLQRSTRSR